MTVKITEDGCPLTYIEINKELADKIPESMRHKTGCEGDFMMLANEDECRLLGLEEVYDYFIVTVK